MESLIIGWIMRHGAAALFVLLLLGIVGLPIPDETLLTLAGALVRKGELGVIPTLVAGIGGSISGISLSYTIGRVLGASVVLRYGRILHVSPDVLARAHQWFNRIGKWTLAFGYFIPGVRHVTAIAAGSSRLELPVFAAFAYSGALIWSLTFLALGFYAGDKSWSSIDYLRHHRAVVVAGIAIAIGVYVVFRATTRNLKASPGR